MWKSKLLKYQFWSLCSHDLCYNSQASKYVDRKGKTVEKNDRAFKNFFANYQAFVSLQCASLTASPNTEVNLKENLWPATEMSFCWSIFHIWRIKILCFTLLGNILLSRQNRLTWLQAPNYHFFQCDSLSNANIHRWIQIWKVIDHTSCLSLQVNTYYLYCKIMYFLIFVLHQLYPLKQRSSFWLSPTGKSEQLNLLAKSHSSAWPSQQ